MGYSFRDDWNCPGTQAQTLAMSVPIVIAGVLGLLGGFGDETGMRVTGGVVTVLGVLLAGFAISRLRR